MYSKFFEYNRYFIGFLLMFDGFIELKKKKLILFFSTFLNLAYRIQFLSGAIYEA